MLAIVLCSLGISQVNAMSQTQGQAQAIKVRVIDSFQVMSTCKDGQEAAKKLEETRDKLTKEIQELEKARVQVVNDLKVKGSMLSDSARAEAEKKANKLERDYQDLLRESEDAMKVAMQKATEELAKGIEDVVTAVAVKDKLDVVVDKMTGRVIYSVDKVDLTKELVSEMDKKREVRIAQAKNNKNDLTSKKDKSEVNA